MKILAIETSCDETAAAVIGGEEGKLRILSNVVVSQVDIFAEYGGVIPEVAARSHLEAMLPVVHKALAESGLTKDEVDAIAVTHTPGLLGSLLVGTLTARTLAILWGKPLYAVHHLKSHIYANWLSMMSNGLTDTSSSEARRASPPSRVSRATPRRSSGPSLEEHQLSCLSSIASSAATVLPEFPLLALVVSGGHTQIIYMRGHNEFEIIGTTRDDAVGECFDKVAKILGLPYPGGPAIAKCAKRKFSDFSGDASRQPVVAGVARCMLARKLRTPPRNGDSSASRSPQLPYLPKPKVEGLDFSFSGLKTAVLRAVQAELGVPINMPSYELAGKLTEEQRADFAAAFQETACEILIDKVKMALEAHPEARSVVLAGGVSANARLREKITDAFCTSATSSETRSSRSPSLLVRASYSSGRCPADCLGNSSLKYSSPKVFFPAIKYAGDNAAMVGAAAYYEIISGVEATDPYALNIMPRSAIE